MKKTIDILWVYFLIFCFAHSGHPAGAARNLNTSTINFKKQSSTPSAPLSGHSKIFVDANDKGQILKSDGSLTPLGSGSGGGYNYNEQNFDANIGGVDTTDAIDLAISRETTSPLFGTGSLKIVKGAVDASSDNIDLLYFTTIPIHDRAQVEVCLGLKETTSTYVDEDLRVSLYNTTDSIEIRAGAEFIQASTLAGEQCFGPFQLAEAGKQYAVRLTVNNANTNGYTLLIDGYDSESWYVGPEKAQAVGAIVTDSEAFTPSLTNCVASASTFYKRRVGEYLEVTGKLTLTSVSGSITIGLPTGLTPDASKIPASNNLIGNAMAEDVGTGFFAGNVELSGSAVLVNTSTGRFNATTPFTWVSGDQLSINYKVPIQGWVGAWDSMASNYGVKLPEDQVKEIILAWRAKHPKVVAFWLNVETCAINAIKNPNKAYKYGCVSFGMRGSTLYCKLPSGRFLKYTQAQTEFIKTPYGVEKEVVTYMGVDSFTKKYTRLKTYGGKLTENIDQAISRDILAFSMLSVEYEGYPVAMHVHDEVMCEIDETFGSLKQFEELMSMTPYWAEGLPLKAEGWRGKRYRK